MDTVDCTPDWKGIYKYFMYMFETDRSAFRICLRKMTLIEWKKLKAIASK